MEREQHSHLVDGRRHHFWTERLWALAAELPVVRIAIDTVREFDQDCWFDGEAPTIRRIADHARRIGAADLRYPIILSADGALLDGGHRVAKAWLSGETAILAVRLPTDPAPDWITDDEASGADLP